jgi:ribonucleoside-diphosphate reductase alpha chain
MSNENKRSLLRGLYSANGSICGSRVTYKTSSFGMVEDIQQMLLSIGIHSYYTINNPKKVEFYNGVYECKKSYDINITTDCDRFYESIGFIQKYKMNKLKSILENKTYKSKVKENYKINGYESIGYFDVWDITVNNDSHTFWCDGFNISNCSEFTAIPYNACSLASINLSKLYDENINDLDWNKLKDLTEKSIVYLNKVMDINYFPIDKINNTVKKTRPIGLGFMGLSHLLFKLKIPYNSEEALDLSEKIIFYITMIGLQKSIELAKQIGTYETFKYETFIDANKRFFDSKLNEYFKFDINKILLDLKFNGIRNSAITSIAPTGSISFIADSSGGMEPVFALAFTRRIEKLNKEYDIVNILDPVFEQYLKKSFNEEDQKFIINYIANHNGSCQGCNIISIEDQKIFVTSMDLTPDEHLKMLGVIARNTSLSVSKTINLPKETTVEKISEVYLKAHEEGIIGVTVYRDGCREGILSASNSKQKEYKKEAEKRPKDLECDIYKIKIKGEEFTVLIGLLNGEPYEVFVDNSDIDTSKCKKGIIRKQAKRHYDLIINDEIIIKDIAKSFNKIYGTLTRMISMSLRHKVNLEYIVDQLSKSDEFISFDKAISRVIKKYIKDGVKSNTICPNCGEKLIFKEGCKSCPSCFFSFCG